MVLKYYLKIIIVSSDYRLYRKYLEFFDCGIDIEVGRRFTRFWIVSAFFIFIDFNAFKFFFYFLSILKKL